MKTLKKKGADLKKEVPRKHFTVAIFGSARIKEKDPIYRQVYRLGKSIGSRGLDVVTGGGPGIMDAANRGHHDGRKDRHVLSLGLNIILPQEQVPNKHLDIKTEFHLFSARLDAFMLLANVVVVAPGGVGTLLELFYAWQLIQVREIGDLPVILMGDMWKELVAWVSRWPLRRKLLSSSDLDSLFLVRDNAEAMRVIGAAHQAYMKGEKPSCRELKEKMGYSQFAS
jgi:uncharacterized protein (TIGR00730 family)